MLRYETPDNEVKRIYPSQFQTFENCLEESKGISNVLDYRHYVWLYKKVQESEVR